jgi:hypothetical protein
MLAGRQQARGAARARSSAFGAPLRGAPALAPASRRPHTGATSSSRALSVVVRASVFEKFSERSIRVLMLSQQHGKELGSAEVRQREVASGLRWGGRAGGPPRSQEGSQKGAPGKGRGKNNYLFGWGFRRPNPLEATLSCLGSQAGGSRERASSVPTCRARAPLASRRGGGAGQRSRCRAGAGARQQDAPPTPTPTTHRNQPPPLSPFPPPLQHPNYKQQQRSPPSTSSWGSSPRTLPRARPRCRRSCRRPRRRPCLRPRSSRRNNNKATSTPQASASSACAKRPSAFAAAAAPTSPRRTCTLAARCAARLKRPRASAAARASALFRPSTSRSRCCLRPQTRPRARPWRRWGCRTWSRCVARRGGAWPRRRRRTRRRRARGRWEGRARRGGARARRRPLQAARRASRRRSRSFAATCAPRRARAGSTRSSAASARWRASCRCSGAGPR